MAFSQYRRCCFSFLLATFLLLLCQLTINGNAAADFPNQGQQNPIFDLASCQKSCRFSIAESIPLGMSYPKGSTMHASTFSVWSELIEEASETIEIAAFYWSLKPYQNELDQSSQPIQGTDEGEKIFNSLIEAGTKRKLTVKIAQDFSKFAADRPNHDSAYLQNIGAAEVRDVNMWKLVKSGKLHTKLFLVDRKSAYIGSANMDWRSLTQVKEIGIYIKDCPCLVDDIGKIFDIYWMGGAPDAKLPEEWPPHLKTNLNKNNPLPMKIGNSDIGVYVTSSPPKLCPQDRTTDLEGVLSIIKTARKYIYISLMDYYPLFIFKKKPTYWGVLDDALKKAAVDEDVEIRMLISSWGKTRPYAYYFLRSLAEINGAFPKTKILIKLFIVPSTVEQSKIPYARVNHDKFVVTESSTLIGTSNWSGDYFFSAGVSFITEGPSPLRDQLEEVFLRDWNSEFAEDLPKDPTVVPKMAPNTP